MFKNIGITVIYAPWRWITSVTKLSDKKFFLTLIYIESRYWSVVLVLWPVSCQDLHGMSSLCSPAGTGSEKLVSIPIFVATELQPKTDEGCLCFSYNWRAIYVKLAYSLCILFPSAISLVPLSFLLWVHMAV